MNKKMQRCLYTLTNAARTIEVTDSDQNSQINITLSLQSEKAIYDVVVQLIKRHPSIQLTNL